jgi:NitT/TauT family transport system substrate-binding protein
MRSLIPDVTPSSSRGARPALLLAFAMLAIVARPTLAQAPTPATIRLGSSPNDDLTAVVYAQRTGMFAKAGVDIVIEKATNGAAAAAAVAGGATDIGKSSITALFSAHERGLPFTVIAAAGSYETKTPDGVMLVLKESQLHAGKDFNGATISVSSLASLTRIGAAAWIDQHGGDLATVKFVEVPQSAAAATVESRRVAGAEIGEPAQTAALATGKFTTIPVNDAIGAAYVDAVFYTTRGYSDKNPALIRTFARILTEAARYCNAHPEASRKMMSDFTGIPLEAYERMHRAHLGTELTAVSLQAPIDAAARYGMLKKPFPAADLIDPNLAGR